MSYLMGYDVGSSSVKASLLEAETGRLIALASSPEDTELEIMAPKTGWAEQHPSIWWEHIKLVTAKLREKSGVNLQDVIAIGISYQMHGLVLVDQNQEVLRPAIIWCDSRAVNIGDQAFSEIGEETCLKHFLNSPGNFTASKLKWVKDNEPEIYQRIYKAMLPGDFVAMKLTGEVKTTPSGLSEGILWDFVRNDLAQMILDYYQIDPSLLPATVPTFSIQGELTPKAAEELGLKSGTKVAYRAGDQPNNAFSLNVLNPGELAATAGTSGVVYGVINEANYDPKSRVNTFVHVNHERDAARYGVLLCLNGTGILNRWMKENFAKGLTYVEMNDLAAKAGVGADGLSILPYGNGAERTLENKNIGATIYGLDLNKHNRSHVLRAAQEGIVFALNYGVQIMGEMGMAIRTVKAGHANMFLSPLFSEAFASVTGATVELYNTDGSQGAARGAGVGAGIYRDYEQAFTGLKSLKTITPDQGLVPQYREVYERWLEFLKERM
jgi:xylulokinase